MFQHIHLVFTAVYSSSCWWYLRMVALSFGILPVLTKSVVIPSKKIPAGQSGPSYQSTDYEDGGRAMQGGGSVVRDGRVLMDWDAVTLKNFDPGPQIPPPSSSLPWDCEPGPSHCYLLFILICCCAATPTPPFQSQNIQTMKKVVWGITMTITAILIIIVYFQKQSLCQK